MGLSVCQSSKSVALSSYSTAKSFARMLAAAPAAAATTHQSSTVQQSEYAQRQIAADVVDFAAGQPSPRLLPLQQVAQAAADRLAGPGADPLLLQYGPEAGYASFRATLSDFLTQSYAAPVPPDHLMITAGVSHGLDLVCRHLAAPGDTLLLEQPTYFLAQTIFNQNRLNTVPIPSDQHGIDTEALEQLLAGGSIPKPRLLYVIPAHSNPRGVTLPLERRRHLIRLAHQYGFLLVADEVYQLLSFPAAPAPPPPMRAVEQQLLPELQASHQQQAAEQPAQSAAAAAAGSSSASRTATSNTQAGWGGGSSSSQVISLGSFSKIMAPGLRLGWVEAAPQHLAALCKDGVLGSGGSIAPLSSGIAHSALQQGLLQGHLTGTIRPALERQCAALCDALARHLQPQGCAFHRPQGGYFVWLQLPQQVDSRALLQLASTQYGVKFAPGPVCQGPPNCVRLSFSFYEPQDLAMGAERLAAALQAYLSQNQ